MRKWNLGALAALVALYAAPAFGVSIELSVGEIAEGRASVSAILRSEGGNVGGMQNDILFDSSVVNLPGVARCTINPAIGTGLENCDDDPANITEPCKTLSRNLVNCGTTPTAPGCDGQAANISRFRGIIAATAVPNNNAIPDGAVLYTCSFDVVNEAGFPTTLSNVNVVASDPFGVRLDSTGTGATIGGGGTDPTPTPTPEVIDGVRVNVGNAIVATDNTARVDVVLLGDDVGGMQNDILFDSSIVNLTGVARCTINPAIGTGLENCDEDPANITEPCKTLSRNLVNCGTTPTAPGCDGQGANISRFRGIIAATAVPNNNSIPSGTVLYSCNFDVINAGALPTTLTNTNIVASDPFGVRLDASGSNGSIAAEGTPPTPTPTVDQPTNTPTVVPPSNTPTVVPATSTPTNTIVVAPATATATATQVSCSTCDDDDDGCHISTSGSSNRRGWLLLIPALGMLVLRRRRA